MVLGIARDSAEDEVRSSSCGVQPVFGGKVAGSRVLMEDAEVYAWVLCSRDEKLARYRRLEQCHTALLIGNDPDTVADCTIYSVIRAHIGSDHYGALIGSLLVET